MTTSAPLAIQTVPSVEISEDSSNGWQDSPSGSPPSDFCTDQMNALHEKIHAERAALQTVHQSLLQSPKTHSPTVQVVDHLLRTIGAYNSIEMEYEPVGLKFYVEEILAYLAAFVTNCPAQHDVFFGLGGAEIVLTLLKKLPWQDGDLVMSILHPLILSGGRGMSQVPTAELVGALATIVGGYLHYEQLRGECAEQGVVFPAPQLTTLALPLDITWHILQYAPAPVFNALASAAENAGLPAMMSRLGQLEQLSPGMKERVRQIEYMLASVRGVWSKFAGAMGNVFGILNRNKS